MLNHIKPKRWVVNIELNLLKIAVLNFTISSFEPSLPQIVLLVLCFVVHVLLTLRQVSSLDHYPDDYKLRRYLMLTQLGSQLYTVTFQLQTAYHSSFSISLSCGGDGRQQNVHRTEKWGRKPG